MSNKEIVEKIASDVREKFGQEGTGHDWWHIFRVWQMAKKIGAAEHADMFIIELAALLHDIADWKFHDGDDTVGPKVAREVMILYQVPGDVIELVCDITAKMSFKGANVKNEINTLEGMVVQDADRLDGIGAIGIARAFAYGGHKNRLLYHPDISPVMHQTKESYIKSEGTTLNHFYEKLLLLKDRMNTDTAKKIAEGRHAFMQQYVSRFLKEWDGIDQGL